MIKCLMLICLDVSAGVILRCSVRLGIRQTIEYVFICCRGVCLVRLHTRQAVWLEIRDISDLWFGCLCDFHMVTCPTSHMMPRCPRVSSVQFKRKKFSADQIANQCCKKPSKFQKNTRKNTWRARTKDWRAVLISRARLDSLQSSLVVHVTQSHFILPSCQYSKRPRSLQDEVIQSAGRKVNLSLSYRSKAQTKEASTSYSQCPKTATNNASEAKHAMQSLLTDHDKEGQLVMHSSLKIRQTKSACCKAKSLPKMIDQVHVPVSWVSDIWTSSTMHRIIYCQKPATALCSLAVQLRNFIEKYPCISNEWEDLTRWFLQSLFIRIQSSEPPRHTDFERSKHFFRWNLNLRKCSTLRRYCRNFRVACRSASLRKNKWDHPHDLKRRREQKNWHTNLNIIIIWNT